MADIESPAEVYERYLGRAIADPFTRVLLDCAGPRPGERVLDLAAGTGSVARHVAPIVGTEGRVVAVDINAAMLAVGRALPAPAGPPVEWREGDAVDLDLPDQSFDLVLCQQGLQFFPDRAAAVREIRRVLTPEGRAVISVWQDLDHHPVYKALFEATACKLRTNVSDFDVSFSLGNAGGVADATRGRRLQTRRGDASLARNPPALAGTLRAAHGGWRRYLGPLVHADEPRGSIGAGRGHRRRA